ncbi:hypothetical protein [Nocardia heshunensis]
MFDAKGFAERNIDVNSTWYPNSGLLFDDWVLALRRQPVVRRFHDHPGRRYDVTLTSANPSAGVDAVSPDGRWRFTGGVLHTRTARAALPDVYCFENWTNAEFFGNDQLVLALNTGQPMHDDGASTGSRQGIVMVLQLADDQQWQLIAFEWGLENRDHDEEFVPDALVWHRRGVLAWLYKGELRWHVRKPGQQPPTRLEPLYLTDLDSDFGLTAYSGELYNVGHAMTLDETGRILTIQSADGIHLVDVDDNTQSTDGTNWEPIPDGLILRFD